jgi:Ca-activated chloride channel family protein
MAAEISSAIMPVAGSDLRAALDLAARTMGDNPGPILVVADMIDDVESLAEFRRQNSSPVILFAVCQQEVSELPQFRQAASQLNASVIQIAADDSDTQTIVQEAASAPVAIAAADESTRWQEAGWWLCPLLAAICLAGFRRVAHSAQETVK